MSLASEEPSDVAEVVRRGSRRALRRPTILIVDDEPNMVRSLRILLSDDDRYDVLIETDGPVALERIEPHLELMIVDLSIPDVDGMQLLRRAKQVNEDIQVIMMTAYSTVESAVEAMKLGAFEYLIKPFSEDEIRIAVEKALRVNRLQRENRRLKAQLKHAARPNDLIGESEPMKRLGFVIERAAASDATALITGESGSGKELVARAIHFTGRRVDGPFVAINCAAISDSLLESELFGHERGAFTGAIRTKLGRLEQAHGGTLLLDEIGDMSPALQTKLLRALEERTFHRVGGTDEITVDVRFVAATNRDLERAITRGDFREDLYYRLNVIAIRVPPLRERIADLPLLVDFFLDEVAKTHGTARRQLSGDALQALRSHSFKGNVRELQNILERAQLMGRGATIEVHDLPLTDRRRDPIRIDQIIDSLEGSWARLQEEVKELERQLVARALDAYHDRPNAEIAAILGTSRRVLELRVQEFSIAKAGKPRVRG